MRLASKWTGRHGQVENIVLNVKLIASNLGYNHYNLGLVLDFQPHLR